ncbi:MAG TPA: serine/threonine-protein kinase [Kofleriaceae bacterium]|nr:serine/threonine-protein kinase [Kofleriaceae bacterium]
MGGDSADESSDGTTATVNLHRLPAVAAPTPTPTGDGSTGGRTLNKRTPAMPLDLLTRDEAARASVFALLMISLAGLGIPLIALFHIDHAARVVFGATVFFVFVLYGYVWWFSHRVERYSVVRLGVVSQFAALTACGLVYTFGVYSPAPVVSVVALYALALSGSFGWSFASYVTCATSHIALALAIRGGWIADHAMIPASILEPRNQLLTMGCIQSVYALAFAQGRWSRAKTVEHLADLELAMRQVAERDALLAEVHRRMDAAAMPGQAGRFTGHQLGSFKLGPLLGRGGMGEIYDATHTGSGEAAAVKLLARHALAEPTKIARFLRELDIARTLRARHVASVLEVGDLSADLPYLAMERLKGHDLDKHLRAHGRLTAEETAELVQHVADGLTAAHAAGIVHRDLKPSNVFRCEPDGEGLPIWKILDFGVSKLGTDSQITHDAVVGTPAYMSPEQAKGETVDVRTDVYGLGAIAYAALTGASPFGGGSAAVVMTRVIRERPRPPSELTDVPRAIDAVIARAMAKSPAERYATPAELAAAVKSALRGDRGE